MSEKRLTEKELQLVDTEKLNKMLESQRKLANDKDLMKSLPDKGEKVLRRIGQIELVLKLRGANVISTDQMVNGKQEQNSHLENNNNQTIEIQENLDASHIIQFNSSFISPLLEEFEKKLSIIEQSLLFSSTKKQEEGKNNNAIGKLNENKKNEDVKTTTTSKQSNVLASTVVEEFFPVKTMSQLITESKAENNNGSIQNSVSSSSSPSTTIDNNNNSGSFLRRKMPTSPTSTSNNNESNGSIFAKRNSEQKSFKLGSRAENKPSKIVLLDPKKLPPTNNDNQ